MFIYSLKASTLKFIAVVIISIGLLLTLITIIPNNDPLSASASTSINYKNVKTNEDRVIFLSQFGWQVNPEATETVEVIIPKEFDAVYTKYNQVQKQQGLNLEKYKNKTVRRYTYVITNYPDYDGIVYANILIYKDNVIGGDICTADMNGFMHGFEKENQPLY